MQGKALVAMSGGVDSTVAAHLMLGSGYECAGAMIRMHHGDNSGENDARAAAEQLGVYLYMLDFSKQFDENVIKKFVYEYGEGRTPNPCILCNRHIKFGLLLEWARELGYDFLATGHYARVSREASGRYLLKRGTDFTKDQSYVLYSLTQEQLAAANFPLGQMSKQEVREIAAGMGFRNAQKSESQDICFVPDGDYARFIEEYVGAPSQAGRFVDEEGNDLGEHKGLAHYTIGQRRGLGLSMQYPAYVLEIRAEDGAVVVGRNEALLSKSLMADDINLIAVDSLEAPMRAQVKIRYGHAAQPAIVSQVDDGKFIVEFDEPQRAITRGQAAVIYDGDVVIGGGTII
ncbi:MAG: tRNA 2-thiouridine(34) synthase MnmA [Oscillospiraceae bacterium]|nr:tRNA 2-thiouridine(34) synthase MnmA [Oscillospiraceae bacterium]